MTTNLKEMFLTSVIAEENLRSLLANLVKLDAELSTCEFLSSNDANNPAALIGNLLVMFEDKKKLTVTDSLYKFATSGQPKTHRDALLVVRVTLTEFVTKLDTLLS